MDASALELRRRRELFGVGKPLLAEDDHLPVLSALTDQNETQLRKIAQVGKGKYFRAKEGTVGVDEISSLLHGMKQAENRARKISIAEDRYALVLLLGFFFLLAEALLPEAFYARKDASKVAARGSAREPNKEALS